MTEWRLLTEEEAQRTWDKALLHFPDHSAFQSFAWGQYRRALGWEPCYFAAYDQNGKVVAMMLGLLRRYFLGFGLLWSEGGPVGDFSVCGEDLQKAVQKATGLKRIYCRFRCDRERFVEDAIVLSSQGWSRSWFPLTSNYSMGLDLRPSESEIFSACDRDWRRNLRRARETNLTLREWHNPDVDEVLAVYESMQAAKGIGEQQSRAELKHLIEVLQNNLILYRCDDEDGNILSLAGWVVFGGKAYMWLVATMEAGRKLHASYAIFWALLQHCKREQIDFCDLCGIDPVLNRGVYRFKRGTGASHLEYLGEWDWASRGWLLWLGNWAISRRARLKVAEAKLKKLAVRESTQVSVRGGRTPQDQMVQQRVA